MVDYSEHVDPVSDDTLGKLSRLGSELAEAEEKVEQTEEQLGLYKKRVTDLAEVRIPELMDQVGLSHFTTREGLRFKVVDSVHAHISKANHVEAMQWLDDNGHGPLVKRNVIIEFGQEQEESALELAQELQKKYAGVLQKRAVHASTLKAWAREQLEEGKPFPLKLFGIHTRRVAKIG